MPSLYLIFLFSRLSFLLVIMFLAIFGVIVLAEVLFMEDGKNEILYDDQPLSSDLLGGGWETPKPLVAMTSPPTPPDRKVKREKLKESLKRHQIEMERLIKNISLRIKSQKVTESPPPTPFRYQEEPKWEFDFTLKSHSGFDAQWQPVNGTKHKFYVYSAYYDNRTRPLIRVIGATKTKRYA